VGAMRVVIGQLQRLVEEKKEQLRRLYQSKNPCVEILAFTYEQKIRDLERAIEILQKEVQTTCNLPSISLNKSIATKEACQVVDILKFTKDAIKEALKEASIKREFVYIGNYQRGIGKTTALIEFAKEFNFMVVVPTYIQAENCREYFGYDKIISQYEVPNLKGAKCKFVFDERVEPSIFNQFHLEVVTGFVN
jgi:predicted RNase H-like nuclease (RuvC/YqgF family)